MYEIYSYGSLLFYHIPWDYSYIYVGGRRGIELFMKHLTRPNYLQYILETLHIIPAKYSDNNYLYRVIHAVFAV